MTMNGQKRLTGEPIAHDDPTALSTAAGWSARAKLETNAAYGKPDNAVDHPSHYTSHPSGVECISIIEHMPYNVGAAVGYLWRHQLKGNPIQDLQKAAWHINREIQRLESEAADG